MSLLLIGTVGFALDGSQMFAQQQMAQAAADAAAEAGIMSILKGTNATSTYTFGTGSNPASSTCTTTDGRTPCVYARDNGFGGTSSDTVTLSFPSSVSGVTLSGVSVPALQVTVQRTLQNSFIRLIGGPATTTISAKAIAGLTGTVSPDSIIVLGSGLTTFSASNGASIKISGGAIAVDSANIVNAANITGGATVTAAAFDSVGPVSVNNGATLSPSAVTGISPVADPLASLPAPAAGSCLYSTMYFPPTNTTLVPGTYCGGINVTNGATNVTFSPGNYIMNGGGLTFGGGATASGSGVMFYLSGTALTYAPVTIANGVTVNFSAPTSGTYQGILFYQNRSIVSLLGATFAGGASMTLSGTLYFPTTGVSFSNGTSANGATIAIVSSTLTFAGGASIKYDPTGQKTGLFSSGAALIQ